MSIFFILLTSLIIAVIYYIKHIIGEVNFYELMYHLFNNGTTAAGSSKVFIDAVKACIWTLFLSAFILFLLNIVLSSLIIIIVIFIVSLLYLLYLVGIIDYFINYFRKTYLYDKYYVDTNKVEINFKEKRNLILIYLESMENSLFSKENGGMFDNSIIKELEEIAKDNISFSNTEKLGGGQTIAKTSFTAASLIASTTATPINTRFFEGYTKNKFMNNVKALGDVLKENGYNLEVVQGSDLDFANENYYFSRHGNYKMLDYSEMIKRNLIDKDYFVWWGVEDKKVFEYAKEELKELSSKDAPFALTMFTMDTHFKDGYVDDDTNIGDNYTNAYASSSKKVKEFLDYIKTQDYYKNTTIILLGDHTSTQNTYFTKVDKKYNRTFYNAIINSNRIVKNNKNRCFTTFDMYPTILYSIGGEIKEDRIGLGTNLFSLKKTLAEEIGIEKLNEETKKYSDYYKNNLK